MTVDFEKYTCTVGANTNVNATRSSARSSDELNDIGKSGDGTLNNVGIENIGEKSNTVTDAHIDSEISTITSPSSSPSLTACKNAKKALDKINGLDIKKMDLQNLITLFMSMVCESEFERSKTLQEVSNQMGIANLNLALNKRDTDRYAAEMQYSSSTTEAIGTIAQSGAQLAAVTASAWFGAYKMKKQNAELESCREAKASANLQKKLNENNKSLTNYGNKNLNKFDAGDKTTRQSIIDKCGDEYKKDLESRKLILEDAESRGFTKLKENGNEISKNSEDVCNKFKVTVKNNDFTADDGKGNELFTKENKTYTSDKFYEDNGEDSAFLKKLDSRIDRLTAEINIAENKAKRIQGAFEASGGFGGGFSKLGAAGDKYKADKAKADKEAIDAYMNFNNNLWSNFRQDFSAALNRVDKTASILKESIDALLQTNMQISRNI